MEVDEIRGLHEIEGLPCESLGSGRRTLGGERSGAHASPSDLRLAVVGDGLDLGVLGQDQRLLVLADVAENLPEVAGTRGGARGGVPLAVVPGTFFERPPRIV